MNDLPRSLPLGSQSVLYADDTTLICPSEKLIWAHNKMRHALDVAEDWFLSNGLRLNEKKTKKLVFSLKPGEASGASAKLLGLWIDERLNWNRHTEELSKRLSRVVYLLSRLRSCVPDSVLMQVYYGLFHSLLSYGVVLWGNCSSAVEVFKCQKRAVRAILGKGQREHCKPLFRELSIMSLPSLYVYQSILFVYSNLENIPTNSDLHCHDTRLKNSLNVPRARLSKYKKSCYIDGVQMYNKLPDSFKDSEITPLTFKKRLKLYLTDLCLYSPEEL